jgi:tRNA threonylcarbamoyladenosine biosynthesis protein TsaB
MKILSLEFSTSQRSVAIAADGCHVCEAIETSSGHTMHPFSMIRSVLEQAAIDRDQIDHIVVGLGPGSYTGIRASIAMAQGWQLAREVALLGISSVEAVAAQAQADGMRGTVQVVVDAQRGEFYLGTWQLSDAGQTESAPLRIIGQEEIQARETAGDLVIGPEVTRWFPSGRTVFPRAAMLAQLASKRTAVSEPTALAPIYLRETTFVKSPKPRAGFV